MTCRMVTVLWVMVIFALASRVAYHYAEWAGRLTTGVTMMAALVFLWLFFSRKGAR